MKVPYVDLGAQWREIRSDALEAIDEILCSGKYLEHEVVEHFEETVAEMLGVSFVTTLNSGTDALLFSLVGLGIKAGDEVITVPNSFIATAAAISHVGAKPIMVDVGSDHLIDVSKIRNKISSRTKAILPVHLEGKICDMTAINEIAKENNLIVIEDAAQAFGSRYHGKFSGSLGDAGCFSLHPLKNLNALGDGGFIATNNAELNDYLRAARNHGQRGRNSSSFFGQVSRLDSLQAAILKLKLKTLDDVIAKRTRIAKSYNLAFSNSQILTPIVSKEVSHSYHLYVIEIDNRDYVAAELEKKGIQTKIHYPKLITEQEAYIDKFGRDLDIPSAIKQSRRILSIPVHHHLSESQVDYVISVLLEIAGG